LLYVPQKPDKLEQEQAMLLGTMVWCTQWQHAASFVIGYTHTFSTA